MSAGGPEKLVQTQRESEGKVWHLAPPATAEAEYRSRFCISHPAKEGFHSMSISTGKHCKKQADAPVQAMNATASWDVS